MITPQRRVIIIGSGIAGLYCALRCAEHSQVTIITKNTIVESSSSYAQGGIAAVLDPQDNFAKHIHDTLKAGAQHNNLRAVQLLVQQAPTHIAALTALGVQFSKQHSGQLDLGREGGHSKRRIVHAKDMTGLAVEQALIQAVKHHPNVTIRSWEFALDLVKRGQRIIGVQTVQVKTKRPYAYQADAVVLATGGCGQAYPYTSNPKVVTGDGIAMAIRAGAKVADLEFVQFHPTAYYIPGKAPFLLSEALRGEGAHLLNHLGQRFVDELRPRDYVSRAVCRQQRAGLVHLDMRHKPAKFLKQRFPGIYQRLAQDHLYLDKHLIPITPIAHYLCGGVHTNLSGQTSLPGLYAIGEVAQTGVQGANRLASNSLLECLVFGSRAALAINQQALPSKHSSHVAIKPNHIKLKQIETDTYNGLRQQLQNVMWETGGIVRTAAGLRSGLAEMQIIKHTIERESKKLTTLTALELLNTATVAEQILQAALRRKHSLGCHYRTN